MTEREIILLGFKSQDIKEYEEDETYYYVLDIVNGLSFITPTNEEIKENEWYVEIFNTEPLIRFTNFAELQGLINLLNKKIQVKNDL